MSATPKVSHSIWHYLKNAVAIAIVGTVFSLLIKKVFKGEAGDQLSAALTQAAASAASGT